MSDPEANIGMTVCRCGSLCTLVREGDGTVWLYQTWHGMPHVTTAYRHVCVPDGRVVVYEGRVLLGAPAGTVDITRNPVRAERMPYRFPRCDVVADAEDGVS